MGKLLPRVPASHHREQRLQDETAADVPSTRSAIYQGHTL